MDAIANSNELPSKLERQTPPVGRAYGGYREELRQDFWYSCAYCTITEIEASSIRFTIDHYNSQSKSPQEANTYLNLLWCCDHCNVRKGDIWPDDKAVARSIALYRPDEHEASAYFTLDGERLTETTPSGRYTIHVLGLNSSNLRRLRALRRRQGIAERAIVLGIRGLNALRPDEFPPFVRSDLSRVITTTGLEATDIQLELRRVIVRLSRSLNIDIDPEKRKQAKERRAYLNALYATTPDHFEQKWTISAEDRQRLRRRQIRRVSGSKRR